MLAWTLTLSTLGSCMEYFVNHDLLTNLERLSESDRPHGIKCKSIAYPLTLEPRPSYGRS